MRKILLFSMMTLMTLCMSLTSCQNCKGTEKSDETPDKTQAILVDTTDTSWEQQVRSIYTQVIQKYPGYVFYEMWGQVVKGEDGVYGIDPATINVAFGYPGGQPKSLVGKVKGGELVCTEYDSPWLEDYYTTPLVPLGVDDAVKLLQKEINIEVAGSPVVFRHQLYPGVFEPQFLFGNFTDAHSVNVYSGQVDVLSKKEGKAVLKRDPRSGE